MTLRRTETPHRYARGLQALPAQAILTRLLEGQQEAAAAVASALPAIEAAAQAAAAALKAGGKLGYAGAGSSGLMAQELRDIATAVNSGFSALMERG